MHMAKQRPRRIRSCAYCGRSLPVTRDHVVPKCLFGEPLPKFLVTVPACDDCNNLKSRSDDVLRDYLVMDINVCEHPLAQRLFQQKMLKSLSKGKSLLGRI